MRSSSIAVILLFVIVIFVTLFYIGLWPFFRHGHSQVMADDNTHTTWTQPFTAMIPAEQHTCTATHSARRIGKRRSIVGSLTKALEPTHRVGGLLSFGKKAKF